MREVLHLSSGLIVCAKLKMAGEEHSAMIFILNLIKQNRRQRLLVHSTFFLLVLQYEIEGTDNRTNKVPK
jgi:hypothetical protein